MENENLSKAYEKALNEITKGKFKENQIAALTQLHYNQTTGRGRNDVSLSSINVGNSKILFDHSKQTAKQAVESALGRDIPTRSVLPQNHASWMFNHDFGPKIEIMQETQGGNKIAEIPFVAYLSQFSRKHEGSSRTLSHIASFDDLKFIATEAACDQESKEIAEAAMEIPGQLKKLGRVGDHGEFVYQAIIDNRNEHGDVTHTSDVYLKLVKNRNGGSENFKLTIIEDDQEISRVADAGRTDF